MGNDLTTTDNRTDLAIQWSEPSLTPRLSELLAAKSIWETDGRIPAISGEDRYAAETALAVYAGHPRGTSAAWVERLLGTLATAFPAGKLSDDEARSRLRVYTASLEDIDVDILRQAVAGIVQTSRFFPAIAEIREAADKLPAPARTVRAWRLRQLLQAEADEVIVDPISATEARGLAATLGNLPARAGATVAPPKPEATIADYLAHGLTEEDARVALADRERMLKRRPRPADQPPASQAA